MHASSAWHSPDTAPTAPTTHAADSLRLRPPPRAGYQPHHDVLVSTSWGEPNEFFKGFDPSKVPTK